MSLSDALDGLLTRARLSLGRPPRYTPVTRLNLLFHVAPLAANDVWRRNVERLRPSLGAFDRRVVGVVRGEGLAPVAEVESAFAGWPVEWVVRDNEPGLGEVATFPAMLALVASTDPGEATFYGHTKGVSRPDNPAVDLWREAMFRACLDDLDAVRHVLRRYACAGAFKKRGPQAGWEGLDPGHFHYAGAFFWFRHEQLFSNPHWAEVRRNRFGVEEYLGRMLPESGAACLFGDYSGSLYDPAEWAKVRSGWVRMARVIGHGLKKRMRVCATRPAS